MKEEYDKTFYISIFIIGIIYYIVALIILFI